VTRTRSIHNILIRRKCKCIKPTAEARRRSLRWRGSALKAIGDLQQGKHEQLRALARLDVPRKNADHRRPDQRLLHTAPRGEPPHRCRVPSPATPRINRHSTSPGGTLLRALAPASVSEAVSTSMVGSTTPDGGFPPSRPRCAAAANRPAMRSLPREDASSPAPRTQQLGSTRWDSSQSPLPTPRRAAMPHSSVDLHTTARTASIARRHIHHVFTASRAALVSASSGTA
jgi:hypothetical protein